MIIGEKEIQGTLETILRPGQIVGEKYRIDRLLGKGGMAAVWAGVNERTGKRVALKVILRSFASSGEAAELFRREALVASRVNHPNVVNVFDVIDHEGMTCIVMELLEGEPFGNYLARKGTLSIEEAAALLLPAMRGVSAANAQGVVHRDLKPQNIFLCVGPDGRLVTTKVLDFGISLMMERAIDHSAATVQLTTLGTPAYMSPEHIAGAPNIDARADVYGFGVLFFEALTGRIPFPGEPGPALLMRILTEPPPKLSHLRPDVPLAVVQIIERAMAKEASDRFPSLDHFVGAVEDHLLPNSSLPRTLTPLAGVPLFSLRESPSGVADSIVQAPHRTEPSGLHEINETMSLYTLPRMRETSDGESSRRAVALNRIGESAVPHTARVNLIASGRRFLARRGVVGGMFGGVLMLVLWLAIPNPTGSHGLRKAPEASAAASHEVVAHVPAVAPLKASEPVPATPAPAIPGGLAAGVAAGGGTGELVPVPTVTQTISPPPTPPSTPNPTRKYASVGTPDSARSVRPARAQPDERRNHRSSSVTPSISAAQSSAPRAGRLSPDDF